MSTLATHLVCPDCGCSNFEEYVSEFRNVEFIVEYDEDGEEFEIVKDEDEPDYDTNYVCGDHCGFETDDPEKYAVFNDEFVCS
jgi:hypothetical protein